jgi:hypothetical protein
VSPWYQVLVWMSVFGFAIFYLVTVAVTKWNKRDRYVPPRARWSKTRVREVVERRIDRRRFLVEYVPEGVSAYQVCMEPGIPTLDQEYQPNEDGKRYVVENISAAPVNDRTTWTVLVKYVPLAEAAYPWQT